MITNLADFYRSKAWEAFIRVLAAERTDENGLIICEHCGKPIITSMTGLPTTKRI